MSRILIIEDEDNLRFSIRRSLQRVGHDVVDVATAEQAIDCYKQQDFDLVLTDINLPGMDGHELIRQIRSIGGSAGIIVLTAYGTVESAVTAMRDGADDYIQKPLSLKELEMQVERLLSRQQISRRLNLYERLQDSQTASHALIGQSDAWLSTLALAHKLACEPRLMIGMNSGVSDGHTLPAILLVGETGTGKSVLAQHIHNWSDQHAQADSDNALDEGHRTPFVHVNCSSLPATEIEQELFGSEAPNPSQGLFEMAQGGTIFLDEIGDLTPEAQRKILSAVEHGIIKRISGNKEYRVSVRIVAATNRDFHAMVRDGRFRQDLLYRLNAFTVTLPPLRERGIDNTILARALLERLCKERGRSQMSLSPKAEDAIKSHGWHGNVRELLNVVQRVVLLCEHDEIQPADLALMPLAEPEVAVQHHTDASPAVPGSVQTGRKIFFDFDTGVHTADEVEKSLIIQALDRTSGNVSKAAKLIRMQRSSLRYRIERFGLESYIRELTHR